MIPPGTLIVGKDEYEFQPHQELGMILRGSPESDPFGSSYLYRILYMDGSTGCEYEPYVRNYYEVIP